MRTEFSRATGRRAGVLACAILLGIASAQYGNAPFIDRPLETSQAFGLELMTSRFFVLEALDPVPDEYLEQAEKLLDRDFLRFAGTLAARDAALAEDLQARITELIEAVEAGESVAPVLDEVRDLHARAYAAVIGEERLEQAPFRAAVLADLLLGDDGVAEAYEDAAEDELWEYPNGWGALQRVQELWAGLRSHANAAQVADFEEMIDFLEQVVYPRPAPPEGGIRGDPEEAEGATQRMVGILESVTDADLYPGRDLARLTDSFLAVLEPSCEAYAAGDAAVGAEGVYAVRDPYGEHLGRLLDLIAPDIHEAATGHLDALISSEPPARAAEACRELLELLTEARAEF